MKFYEIKETSQGVVRELNYYYTKRTSLGLFFKDLEEAEAEVKKLIVQKIKDYNNFNAEADISDIINNTITLKSSEMLTAEQAMDPNFSFIYKKKTLFKIVQVTL